MARAAAAGAVPERYRRRAEGGFYFGKVAILAHVAPAAEAGGVIGVAILAALRAWAGKRVELDGDDAPSVRDLARLLGIGIRTAQAKLGALERAGLICVSRPAGRKPRWTIPPYEVAESANPNPRSSCGGPRQDMRTPPAPAAEAPRRSCGPAPGQRVDTQKDRKASSEGRYCGTTRRRSRPAVAAAEFLRPFDGGAGDLTARRAQLARQRAELAQQASSPGNPPTAAEDELLRALERENMGDLRVEVEGGAS